MGKDLEQFTDDLVEETLAEAASSFFGMRRSMEDEKDLFLEKMDYLRSVRAKVMERAATLEMLLLGQDNAVGLYKGLGVDPGAMAAAGTEASPISGRQRERLLPMPKVAVTRAGIYYKLVFKAYAALQDRLDEYLHGRFYPDPHGGSRKFINPYHRQMVFWCQALNERIAKANANIPPSETRRFVKALQPGLAEMERIMDAPLDGFDDVYDRELALEGVDCSPLDEMALPELPQPVAARDRLEAVCRHIWETDKARVLELLDNW